MVKIATGRDAADTAIANIFGSAFCTDIRVSCEVMEPGFEAFFYQPDEARGVSYA